MSPLDHFTSIDQQLTDMRKHFEEERKALQDQVFVAQTEAALAKEQLKTAVEARALAERRATRLLTQFGTVAQIFEEAKQVALEITRANIPPEELAEALSKAMLPPPSTRMESNDEKVPTQDAAAEKTGGEGPSADTQPSPS